MPGALMPEPLTPADRQQSPGLSTSCAIEHDAQRPAGDAGLSMYEAPLSISMTHTFRGLYRLVYALVNRNIASRVLRRHILPRHPAASCHSLPLSRLYWLAAGGALIHEASYCHSFLIGYRRYHREPISIALFHATRAPYAALRRRH